MAITLAFQANDVGSIPTSRSKLKSYGTVTRKAREWIANPFYAGSYVNHYI